MKIRMIREGEGRVEIEVERDLLTLFTALQHQALEDKRVIFSACRKPHPLYNRTLFAIAVRDKNDAKDVLLRAISSLRERFISLLNSLRRELSQGGT